MLLASADGFLEVVAAGQCSLNYLRRLRNNPHPSPSGRDAFRGGALNGATSASLTQSSVSPQRKEGVLLTSCVVDFLGADAKGDNNEFTDWWKKTEVGQYELKRLRAGLHLLCREPCDQLPTLN